MAVGHGARPPACILKICSQDKRDLDFLPRHSGALLVGPVQAVCLLAELIVRASSSKLQLVTTAMWSAEGVTSMTRKVAAMTGSIAIDVAPMAREVAPMIGRPATRVAAQMAVLALITLLLLSAILASTSPGRTARAITALVSSGLHSIVGTAAVRAAETSY